jgi:hypothetical protein
MCISVVSLISLWHLHPAKPIIRGDWYALYLDYLRLSDVQPAQLAIRGASFHPIMNHETDDHTIE